MEPGCIFGPSHNPVSRLNTHRNKVNGLVVPPVEYALDVAPGPKSVVVVPAVEFESSRDVERIDSLGEQLVPHFPPNPIPGKIVVGGSYGKVSQSSRQQTSEKRGRARGGCASTMQDCHKQSQRITRSQHMPAEESSFLQVAEDDLKSRN